MAALKRRLDAGRARGAARAPGVAEFLDLVALGTVADVVPLDANNRVLVAQGLRRIRAGPLRAGHHGAAARSRSAARGSDRGRSGLRGGAAAERRRPHRRHDHRHPVPARAMIRPAARAARRAPGWLNEERREIEARMQTEALAAVRRLARPRPARVAAQRRCACLMRAGTRASSAWSRAASRTRAPPGDRLRARRRRRTARLGPLGAGRAHPRRARCDRDARNPISSARFGGHAMAAGLTLERVAASIEFARAFDAEVARWAQVRRVPTTHRDRRRADRAGDRAGDRAARCAPAARGDRHFPSRTFDGVFKIRNTRIVGERHVKMWVEVRTPGAPSMPSPSTTWTSRGGSRHPAGRCAPGVPPGHQRVPGRAPPAAAGGSRAAGARPLTQRSPRHAS